jgi:hypothetical protein
MINILFLLAYAFYAGFAFQIQRTFTGNVLYITFVSMCACLFYTLPLVYIGGAILSAMFVGSLFMLPKLDIEGAEKINDINKLNMVISTLLFWPCNMFDLVYFSILVSKKMSRD